MTYYKVKKQPIFFNGGTYYPERAMSKNKTLPADVIEMTDEEAGAWGEEYIEEVRTPKKTSEKIPESPKKEGKSKK